jgi:site-specific DNA recombinase
MMQATLKQRRAGRNGAAAPTTVRVAIYTRKSTEEGLDQEFNSLDAQREAVEAYVLSHQAEGWIVLPESYDDGGFSGATTDRPAFQRLIRDIEAGKVDVVGVYKLDRLSRSLLDFLQTQEFFRKHDVTFVAVTQRIDTSGSMGEFVSNLFAALGQLERRMISERTSDKMRAARRKGLWMGGVPPLGYDAVEKRLVVNLVEAERVQAIFGLFADLGSLVQVVEEVDRRGWHMKGLPARNGKAASPRPFTTTSVKRVLTNAVYAGKVVLAGKEYAGAHEAIVDGTTWEKVQRLIAERRGDRRPWRRSKHEALLRGLVRCGACGSAMTVRYTKKGDRKYHYYQCVRILKEGAAACPGSQVAAARLEAEVVAQIRAVGRKPELLDEVVRAMERELAERRPELAACFKAVENEKAALKSEERKLVANLTDARDGRRAILDRLGDILPGLEAKDREAEELRAELDALDGQPVDAGALRQAIEKFDGVWEELFPRERARVLGLLLEVVEYEASRAEVRLMFRLTGGLKASVAKDEGIQTDPRPHRRGRARAARCLSLALRSDASARSVSCPDDPMHTRRW